MRVTSVLDLYSFALTKDVKSSLTSQVPHKDFYDSTFLRLHAVWLTAADATPCAAPHHRLSSASGSLAADAEPANPRGFLGAHAGASVEDAVVAAWEWSAHCRGRGSMAASPQGYSTGWEPEHDAANGVTTPGPVGAAEAVATCNANSCNNYETLTLQLWQIIGKYSYC